MQAQAVVAVEAGRIELKTVWTPDPRPDDVLVRVQHSWISPGTERSMIMGERIDGETAWSPTDPLPFPHVPGYQKVGVVEWVGGDVSGVQPGQQVFVTVSKVDDMFYPTGGHISPAVTHHSQVWPVPEHVAPVALSGLVLTQVGYNCAIRPTIVEGDAVVVVGDGLIGHWASQALAHRGARVMMVGRHDSRLAYFAARENDRAVNSSQEDSASAARDWAPEGIQAVLDTVGSVSALELFFPLMRRDGHWVSAGFHGTRGTIDIQRLRPRELSLHTPSGWTSARMDATHHLISCGVLQTERLISHRFPVARAAEAFDLALHRHEPFLGVILDWDVDTPGKDVQ